MQLRKSAWKKQWHKNKNKIRKISIFWDKTPCSTLDSIDVSEEHVSSIFMSKSKTKKERAWNSWQEQPGSGDFQRTTRRYILDDRTLHAHRCENLKSKINKTPFHCTVCIALTWSGNNPQPPLKDSDLHCVHCAPQVSLGLYRASTLDNMSRIGMESAGTTFSRSTKFQKTGIRGDEAGKEWTCASGGRGGILGSVQLEDRKQISYHQNGR
jgi:hypothetical protein